MTKPGPNNASGPQAVNRLLAGIAQNKNWRSKLELHKVFEFWADLVGPEIAEVARPHLIRGHVLWVGVTESIWMQQLHLQKMLLLEKINNRLQNEKFSDIRFQLDSSLPPPDQTITRETEPTPLNKKEEQQFDRLISSLDNEDLRQSLKSLWKTIKTRRK